MKYYLRTDTEAQMMAALECLKVDGVIPTDTQDYSLVILGRLEKPPVYGVTGQQTVETFPDSTVDPETGEIVLGDPVPVVVDETGVVTPAVPLSGFHANYQQLSGNPGDLPETIATIVLNPEPGNPLVDWI